MILTIAIPTYNRPDKVKNTILRLLPQLASNVKIVVHDNCSPTIIKDHLEKEIGENVLEKIEVIRNRINIGADSNFQRCFEMCTTPYIWLLGDDDKIEENAVALILDELEKYKNHDLIGINFNSDCNTVGRTKPILISSTSDLANKLDHFGNWLFISTSVYKTEEYLKYISRQAWGAYSMASQIVPAMIAISNNKTFVLSEKYIVTNITQDGEEEWSDFQLALSQLTLLEAPVGLKKNEYRKFGQKICCEIVPIGTVFLSVLKSINFDMNLIDAFHIYIFKQIFKRNIKFRKNRIYEIIKYYIALIFLNNKILLNSLIKSIPYLKKRAAKTNSFNLFKR